MNTSLSEAKNLIKLISDRINNLSEDHNMVSRIEADILLDQLRDLYLVVENLKRSAFLEPDKDHVNAGHNVIGMTPNNQDEPVLEEKEQHNVIAGLREEVNQVAEEIKPVREEVKPVAEEIKPVREEVKAAEEIKPVHEDREVQQHVEETYVPVMTFKKVEVEETKTQSFQETQHSFQETQQVRVEEVKSQPVPEFQVKEPVQVKQVSEPKVQASRASNQSGDLFGTPTIADKLKNEAPSLNDKITRGRSDQSLADKMQLKPIADLKTAIGINEKFQFVNDLFFGKVDLYNDAINNLNNGGSLMNAEGILNNLKVQHNWNDETDAYNKLKTFVSRRYL